MRPLLQVLAVAFATGCSGGGDAGGPDADGPDAPIHTPGTPGVGAHAMRFYHYQEAPTSVVTDPMTTQPAGSTMVVGVGRGMLDAFAASGAVPADNRGNTPYQQLGMTEKYTNWPSGTALYAFPDARGGADHVITARSPAGDEITMAAVEVVDATHVQDFQWNEVLAPNTLTSRDVTTTGPATLIAFWWGDGFPDTTPQTATPDGSFTLLDSNADELHSFVQCAVAFRNVADAGTYHVTWTATPTQGAQLWLIAVQ